MRKKFAGSCLAIALSLAMVFGSTGVYAEEAGTVSTETVFAEELSSEEINEALEVAYENTDVDDIYQEFELVEADNIIVSKISAETKGLYVDVEADIETDAAYSIVRWLVFDFSTGEWKVVRDWDLQNKFSWYPDHTGDYYIYAEVITAGGNVACKELLFNYAGCVNEITDVKIANVTNTGNQKITAEVSSNDIGAEIKFLVYDAADGSWTTIQDWSKKTEAVWTPKKAGTYMIYAQIKGSNGEVSGKTVLKGIEDAKITEIIFDANNLMVGKTAVFEGHYKDELHQIGFYLYSVFDGTSWKTMDDCYGAGVWTPEVAGNYAVCYTIYSPYGEILSQKIEAITVNNYSTEIKSIKAERKYGFTYDLKAEVETNDPGVQYKWIYYRISTGEWHDVNEYGKDINVVWTAPDQGGYLLALQAKKSNGEEINKCEYFEVIPEQVGPVKSDGTAGLGEMTALANQYSSSTGYIILVNRGTHKVGVYKGSKGNYTPVYYWDCANGKDSTPTVTGVYHVAAKGYYFDSGNARCFWYTQFYGNYLFHSVLYNKNTGKLSDGRVGQALSHGCVRLKIENAKWIYDNIPRNTTVVIYN